MRVEDIAIFTGDADRPYEELGPIRARVVAATVFSKSPTIEDVNFKLREAALKMGADGVTYATYQRGMTATSWRGLTVLGFGVKLLDDTKMCPFCAEKVKTQAIKCK